MPSPKETCPCCGFQTLESGEQNEYDICPACFWENDYTQRDDPDYDGGANVPSLRQAQKNFKKFGASDIESVRHVRKPKKQEIKDPNWTPLT